MKLVNGHIYDLEALRPRLTGWERYTRVPTGTPEPVLDACFLDGKYLGPDAWGRTPIFDEVPFAAVRRQGQDKPEESQQFPIVDWQYEVANGDTNLGYEDWVRQKVTEANEEYAARLEAPAVQAVDNAGLTLGEQTVMHHVVEAWNAYLKLPRQHLDDTQEFRGCVHQLQGLLAKRVVRRAYPQGWPAGL